MTIRATAEELQLLPKYAREVLEHLNAGKKYAEISDAIGRPLGTVRSRINRARARVAAIRETTKAVKS